MTFEILNFIFDYIIQGAVTGSVAVSVYLFTKNQEKREIRSKFATMLIIEIRDLIDTLNSSKSSLVPYDLLPTKSYISRDTYDGLINSGNISDFDQDLQKDLYYFYKNIQNYNYNISLKKAYEMLSNIEKFRNKNTPFYRTKRSSY